MLRYAIDHGVNYVDTAYPYHEGKSEIVVGKALRDGYREKVRLATKLPTWLVQAPAGFRPVSERAANRSLQTEHIDFYLLHSLNKATWANVVLKHNLSARGGAGAGRRAHPASGLLVSRQLRVLRRDREGERSVDFLPDPVQLHGRGEPGGHARAEAGRGKGAGRGGDGATDGRTAGRSAAGDSGDDGERSGRAEPGRNWRSNGCGISRRSPWC